MREREINAIFFVNTFQKTMFLALTSFVKTYIFRGLDTRKYPPYSCPWGKHVLSGCTAATLGVCPGVLLTVIANIFFEETLDFRTQ